MGIKEQGFGEGVSLAQRALNQSLQIGQKFEQTGNEIDDYLDNENLQAQTLEARKMINDLYINSNNQTKNFEESANEVKQEILKNARNGKIQGILERDIDSQINKYRNDMAVKNQAEEKNLRVTQTANYLESNKKEIADNIKIGNIELANENYDKSIEAINIAEKNGDISPSTAFLQREKVNKEFVNDKMVGSLKRTTDTLMEGVEGGSINDIQLIQETEDAIINGIKEPEKNKEYFKTFGLEVVNGEIIEPKTGIALTEVEKDNLINSVKLEFSNIGKTFIAKQETEINRIAGNSKVLIERVKKSIPISNEQITAQEMEMRQYFPEEQVDKYINSLKEVTDIFKQPNVLERNKYIKEKYNNDLVKQQKLIELSLINHSNMLKDPITTYINSGEISNIPLSLGEGADNFIAQLDTRIGKLPLLQKKYGAPVDFLSSSEVKLATAQYQTLPQSEKSKLLQYLASKNINTDKFFEATPSQKIGSKSFKENGNSKFVEDTSVVSIYKQDDPKATQVLNELSDGEELMQVEGLVSKDFKQGARNYFYSNYQNRYGVGESVKLENDANNFLKVLISRAKRQGVDMTEEFKESDIFSSDQEELADNIVTDIIGNSINIESGGSEYSVFASHNLTQKKFTSILNGLTPQSMSVINKPLIGFTEMKDGILTKGFRLHSTQIEGYNGYVYQVLDGNGNRLMGDNGRPYMLALEDITGQGIEFVEQEDNLVKDLMLAHGERTNKLFDIISEKGLLQGLGSIIGDSANVAVQLNQIGFEKNLDTVTGIATETLPKTFDILSDNAKELGYNFLSSIGTLLSGREGKRQVQEGLKEIDKELSKERTFKEWGDLFDEKKEQALEYSTQVFDSFIDNNETIKTISDFYEKTKDFSIETKDSINYIIEEQVKDIRKKITILKTQESGLGLMLFNFENAIGEAKEIVEQIQSPNFSKMTEKEKMEVLNNFTIKLEKSKRDREIFDKFEAKKKQERDREIFDRFEQRMENNKKLKEALKTLGDF